MKRAFDKIILKVIPHSFIRAVKKKANVNYLFFGASVKNVGTYLVQDEDVPYNLYNMEATLGAVVAEGFSACIQEYKSHPGLIRKYILAVEDCTIEPEMGWGITQNDKLIFDSISNNSWRESYHPDYFKYKAQKKEAILLDEVVSINIINGGEDNYWHFLHDLLGEVTLALQYIPRKIPFLISKNLAEKSFFKQAVSQSPELASLQWIVRDRHYYKAKKAWFIQTMPSSNEQFFNLQHLLHVPDASILQNSRKVFLTRSRSRIRFLKNGAALKAIAHKYGFEVIDTDGLSMKEQIKIFSETRWLIGIHGAGLTNVLYRKNAAMKVLELLPADYLQPHYFWLSKGMGHEYDCILGSTSGIDTSFEISAKTFEDRLQCFANG